MMNIDSTLMMPKFDKSNHDGAPSVRFVDSVEMYGVVCGLVEMFVV